MKKAEEQSQTMSRQSSDSLRNKHAKTEIFKKD